MDEVNLQKEITESINKESSEIILTRVFGECKSCGKQIGLDADGEYIGCEHHPNAVVRESIIPKFINIKPVNG